MLCVIVFYVVGGKGAFDADIINIGSAPGSVLSSPIADKSSCAASAILCKLRLKEIWLMEILYELYDNLYVNLTNRCPYACTFCLRQTMDRIGGSDRLWLEREPGYEEVIKEFDRFDMSRYKELVFCGFGEPTEAFDILIMVARYVKEKFDIPVRINTNGVGRLINGRDIVPEMEGLIDTVSISLNNPHKDEYLRLVRSSFGEESFDEMISFAKECVRYVPHVVLTTVETTISKEEENECRMLCDEIGARYRIRPFEN